MNKLVIKKICKINTCIYKKKYFILPYFDKFWLGPVSICDQCEKFICEKKHFKLFKKS